MRPSSKSQISTAHKRSSTSVSLPSPVPLIQTPQLEQSSLTERPSEHAMKDPQRSLIRTLTPQDLQTKKPISLAILEKYFSDVIQSISQKSSIDPVLLAKAETMHNVLKDCLTVIHDLSLDIYILMASSLKDIQHIRNSNDERFLNIVLNKLLQVASLIEDNNYRSATEKAAHTVEDRKNDTEADNPEDIGKELNARISRVTARVLNIWKKIVCPQKEAGIICSCFLLLYCEVDSTIKVSPYVKVRYDKAVVLMKNYSANPGYVVTVIRKTKEYIEKEKVSVEVIRRINDSLQKITVQEVKNIDRTSSALVLYEMLVYAVKYYEMIAMGKYGVSVFDLKFESDRAKDLRLSEKSIGILQSDNFGIVLQSQTKIKPLNPVLERHSLSPQKSLNAFPLSRSKKTAMDSSKIPFQPAKSPVKPTKSPAKSRKITERRPQSSFSPQKLVKKLLGKNLSNSIDQVLKPAKKISNKLPASDSQSANSSPTRPRPSLDNIFTTKTIDHRDVLEEMQYQQFIEEKFRFFLVDKLNQCSKDFEPADNKAKNEEKAMKNRENWMNEFEKRVGVIRFNAIQRLGDEKRFTAELIRAQRQLETLESHSNIQ